MEEAPENGKELSHSAHANGMNELKKILRTLWNHFFERQNHNYIHNYTPY